MKRSSSFLGCLLGLATACTGDLPLEGRPCPCAEGWTCCDLTNQCVLRGTSCGPLEITPASPRMRLAASQRFFATVPVTWSVEETNGGRIDRAGLYEAPRRPGSFHVRATAFDGTSASANITVGPEELTRVLGYPGGSGTADGVGQSARFSLPSGIAGDSDFLFAIDEPAPNPDYPELPSAGPSGVRRIALDTREVSWLVQDRALRHLAIANGALFAGERASSEWSSPTRAIVRIDRLSGEISRVAGTLAAGAPSDGVADQARFQDIRGITADGAGALYLTDSAPNGSTALRRIDVASGTVTTVAASDDWPGASQAQAPFKCLAAVTFHDGRVHALDACKFQDAVDDAGQIFGKQQTIWEYEPGTGAVGEVLTGYQLPASDGFGAFCFDHNGSAIGTTRSESGYCVNRVFSDWTGCEGDFKGLGGLWCDGTWWISEGWGQGHGSGSFYVSEPGGPAIHALRRDAKSVEILAGKPEYAGPDGADPAMRLRAPSGITVDSAGTFVLSDRSGRFIEVASGTVNAFSCTASWPAPDPLPPRLRAALGPDRVLYFVSSGTTEWNTELGRLNLETGKCDTKKTSLYGHPRAFVDLVHDRIGSLYLSSCLKPPYNRQIIRVEAGSGDYETLLSSHCGLLAADGEKQLFVADLADASDTYSSNLFSIDLAGLEARALPAPPDGWRISALAYDPSGVLYVAEADRQRVRGLVIETGEVFDLAGIPGRRGVQLGSLPASLNYPSDIALLPDGSLAITDYAENVVLVAQ
jgi:hypothetical protein